jgi:hypothetical protein
MGIQSPHKPANRRLARVLIPHRLQELFTDSGIDPIGLRQSPFRSAPKILEGSQ